MNKLKEFVASYGFEESICNDVILLQNAKQKHFGQKENYDIVENDIEKVKQHIKDRT